MEQPHQHGPQCRHGHGGQGGPGGHGGQSHGHGGHGNQGTGQISPKQYFQKLDQMKKKTPQFYWMEILSGNYFNKYCQQKGFDFLRSVNCQVITMVVAQAQMMFTCQWLPLFLRPFISGMFFPLLFFLFFNFNVIFGVAGPQSSLVHISSYLTLILYALTALRQPGFLTTDENSKKSEQAIKKRIYLQNPNAQCGQCKILKAFRSFHCPMCKVCVSKFTRHSLTFGSCIGSSNQLLAWGFFTTLFMNQVFTLFYFFSATDYGIITNIMFYALNIYILWISFVEFATIGVLNLGLGITQHQVRTWMMNQYLMKVPQRQFVNSVSKGFVFNFIESLYALLGFAGYESLNRKKQPQISMQQEIPINQNNTQFEKIDPKNSYLINWSKAFFYLLPQFPTHPSRNQVIQIMTRDEPRMLEMFKLQKKFRQQVLKQSQGQGLNDFQIQQKVGQKMQQHMMKNNPNMMPQMAPPSAQQQKMMQIQMISHMIGQLSQKEPQITAQLRSLVDSVKEGTMTPMEVGLTMRQIQQQLMKKQMQAVMKQREEAQKAKQSQQAEDEEEQLKNKQIADQDL